MVSKDVELEKLALSSLAGIAAHSSVLPPRGGWSKLSFSPEDMVPLQVIGVGLPRTGTSSLQVALEKLGFGPCFHGRSFPYDQIPFLQEAIEGKQVNWNDILKGYRSVCDFSMFWQDILKANPEAKVIYTDRDIASWLSSMEQTIVATVRAYGVEKEKPIWQKIMEYPFNGDFSQSSMINTWDAQKKNVVESFGITLENLLVFDVKDGWDPLCEFLDVPTPDGSFPHENTEEYFRSITYLSSK